MFMKKSIVCLTALTFAGIGLVSNHSVYANHVKSQPAQSVVQIPKEKSELNFLTYIGFENMTDGFEPATHTFDKSSNELNFQDGVSLINPGVHVFTKNQLIGIKSDGSETILDQQHESGGKFFFNITYKTKINNYKDYTHFRIDVVYHDTLWNNEKKATADFTIN